MIASNTVDNQKKTGSERRRHCRKNVVDRQLVTVDLGDGQTAILVDLSAEGLALQPFLPIKMGTQIRFEFDLPRGFGRIHGLGTVVWVGRTGRLGIRFEHLAERSRKHLDHWLSVNDDPIGDAMRTFKLQADQRAATTMVGESGAPAITDSEEMDMETALALIAEHACTVTRATGAALILGGASGFTCRASLGTAPDPGTHVPLDASLTGECLRMGVTVHCPDAMTDCRVNPTAREHLKLRSILAVPVLQDGQTVGAIEVLCSRPEAFNERDVAKLEHLADITARLDFDEAPAQDS